MIQRLLTLLLLTTTAFAQSPANEKELLQAFQKALAGQDLKSLVDLYTWQGVSENTRTTTAMMLDELTRREIESVTLGRWSHKSETVVRGTRFRPSHPPTGAVIIKYADGKQLDTVEIPYAKLAGAARLISIIEEDAKPGSRQDRRLAISVGGAVTEQPARFEGFYILVVNGKELRQPFTGTVGLTKSMRGEYLKYCEIRKTAGAGAIYLLITADGKTLYESKLTSTGDPITYAGGR